MHKSLFAPVKAMGERENISDKGLVQQPLFNKWWSVWESLKRVGRLVVSAPLLRLARTPHSDANACASSTLQRGQVLFWMSTTLDALHWAMQFRVSNSFLFSMLLFVRNIAYLSRATNFTSHVAFARTHIPNDVIEWFINPIKCANYVFFPAKSIRNRKWI